jgi:hypothetical protein
VKFFIGAVNHGAIAIFNEVNRLDRHLHAIVIGDDLLLAVAAVEGN